MPGVRVGGESFYINLMKVICLLKHIFIHFGLIIMVFRSKEETTLLHITLFLSLVLTIAEIINYFPRKIVCIILGTTDILIIVIVVNSMIDDVNLIDFIGGVFRMLIRKWN